MRDCSWWSSHLLETTPEKVEKEIAKGLDIKGAYESRQSYSSYIEVNIIVPPLICAAKSDNIKVVEVLLKHGADAVSYTHLSPRRTSPKTGRHYRCPRRRKFGRPVAF